MTTTFALHPSAPFIAAAGFSTFAIFAIIQSASPPDLTWYSAQHLTLEGALVVAIIFLWRAFQAKDAALTEMTRGVAKALEQASASNIELRRIIEESVRTKDRLIEAIDLLDNGLGRLPCVVREGRSIER